jgi:hypothetical protein
MDLTAIIKAVVTPYAEPGNGALAGLLPGDRLTGTVVRRERDGHVLMDLKGVRVSAQVGFSVAEGQTLNLQVLKSGNLLHLKADLSEMAPGVPSPSHGLAQLLSSDQLDRWTEIVNRIIEHPMAATRHHKAASQVQNALVRVKIAMEPLCLERPVQGIAMQLQDKLQNHGVFFEKKLADAQLAAPPASGADQLAVLPERGIRVLIAQDIKAQLLIVKNHLANMADSDRTVLRIDAKEVSFLRHSVERFLGHIEQVQDHTITKRGDGDPFQLLSHMLAVQDQNGPVHLKVYYPKRGKKGEKQRQHRIALLLQMDRLGWVRADLGVVDGRLHINFFVQDEATRSQFTRQADAVRQSLGVFFEHVLINVSVSRETIARFHGEDMKEETPGRIDLRA